MGGNTKDEVLKDFKESLSRIDFSRYNPKSSEFETALYTGLMWMLMDECDEDGVDVLSVAVEEEPSDGISEELHDAKKYLQKYLDTRDGSYKDMASDELKHAGILLRKAYNRTIGNEERSRLKKYETEINQVSERISAS